MSQAFVEGALRSKYFYSLALEQGASRHPLSPGVVVAHLQDAVEALASTVAEHMNIGLPLNPKFHEYWDKVVDASENNRLPYRSEMDKLNHARNGFKHKGLRVPDADMEKFLRDAHRFLTHVSETFLGLDFEKLNEADLIQDGYMRSLLKSGFESFNREEYDDALCRCRDAEIIISQQLPALVFLSNPMGSMPGDLANILTRVETALALTMIGIPFADYWVMQMMLPSKSWGNTYQFVRPAMAPTITAESTLETLRILVRMALQIEVFADKQGRRLQVFRPS